MMRFPIGSLGVALVLATTLACNSGSGTNPVIPSSPPSIEGRITAVDRSGERIGSIRVEANPTDNAGSPKAVVRILQTTRLLRANVSGDFNDLRMGDWVRVWFDGPVAQSYPVQAKGGTVVVDSIAK